MIDPAELRAGMVILLSANEDEGFEEEEVTLCEFGEETDRMGDVTHWICDAADYGMTEVPIDQLTEGTFLRQETV
jgi:hypothetical protein